MAEPVDLSSFLTDTKRFLTDLAANNDRDWFRAHKSDYDDRVKRPAERILDRIAAHISLGFGQTPRPKLFRPHRDVRFSDDKTPYHTHVHMLWTLPEGHGWFLGLSPDYATAGVGMMSFEPGQLARYRAAVDGAAGDALAELLAQGWRMDPPGLKRVPAPYDAEHRHAALLRRKGLVVWQDELDAALTADPVDGLTGVFDHLAPVQRWLMAEV